MESERWEDDIENYRHIIRSVFTHRMPHIEDEEIEVTLELLKEEMLANNKLFPEESREGILNLMDILINNVKSLGDKQRFIVFLISDILHRMD